jgi:sugar phosphate isomerase/epimerase
MEGMDISLFGGRAEFDPEEILSNTPHHAARISDSLKEHGLELGDIFGIQGKTFHEHALNHPEAEVRREAERYFWRMLELTARCNGTHLTLPPGVHFEGEEFAQSFARAADELNWRCEAAARLGVSLAVEPHLGSLISTPELTRKLLDACPALSLTLDYSHFISQGIAEDEIEPLVADASHLHLRCSRPGKVQCSLVDNTVDFIRLLDALKQNDYAGWVRIEYVWTDREQWDKVDNLSETLLLRNFLRLINLALDAPDDAEDQPPS